MLKSFVCPDGKGIEVKDCLKSCRLKDRCLSLETLKEVADQRPWNGKPSVTQLFNGPRYNKLHIDRDWSCNPRDRGFVILGQRVSNKLDNMQDRMEHRGVTGLPDYLNHEDGVLTDYKTIGSYKYRLVMGLQKHYENHPTEVYQKSGSWGKAGTPKKVTIWKPTGKRDDFEWKMQLNKYRQMLEKEGVKINRLQIQAIIRDANTIAAEQNGLPRSADSIQLIPIDIVPDEEMDRYFDARRDELLEAMSSDKMPRLCSESECWGGTRCYFYCPVREFCEAHGDNKYLNK